MLCSRAPPLPYTPSNALLLLYTYRGCDVCADGVRDHIRAGCLPANAPTTFNPSTSSTCFDIFQGVTLGYANPLSLFLSHSTSIVLFVSHSGWRHLPSLTYSHGTALSILSWRKQPLIVSPPPLLVCLERLFLTRSDVCCFFCCCFSLFLVCYTSAYIQTHINGYFFLRIHICRK